MNKEYEKDEQIVKAFLDEVGITYDRLFPPTVEPPDVIAKIKEENIGIELVDFTTKKDKRNEAEFEEIFNGVKEGLSNNGISDLIIRITAEKIPHNHRFKRKNCIKAIVDACTEKYKEIDKDKVVIPIQPVPEIKEISAYKNDTNEVIITYRFRQRTVGSLSEEKLKEKIELKIDKLNKSKSTYPDEHEGINFYWLLMTMEGTFYSDYAGVQENIVALDVKNSFDRIFVFNNHRRNKWFEEIKIA